MSASRSTASNLSAGLAGLLFGLGLVLAGMADPNKVLASSTSPAPGILRSAW